eukprot:COSAG05_NODE_8687_length_680_cov_1.547332_2_plen_30_part_01
MHVATATPSAWQTSHKLGFVDNLYGVDTTS